MASSIPDPPPDKPFEEMSVEELARAVRYHNYRYFVLNDAIISDYAFDRLTRHLMARDPEHEALSELWTDATATGDKAFHDHPMLSLDKCYDEETLTKWAATFEGEVTETPKIDGVAASFKYQAGRLYQAVTRGDGVRGEVFTDNARYIPDVPHEIPHASPVEVRGEIYMTLSAFRSLEGDFSNPRNTTAGAIKQKLPEKTADYKLSFYLYDILGPEFETEMDKVAWAKENRFVPVETALLEKDQLQAGYERWVARRDSLDFEVDGVVYKANSTREQRRLGATSHHPRYAIAYKFQGESSTSTLERVEWSVSRTGAITPVAIIEPVQLSGAMVSRCSLHNLGIMAKLGLSIGATVVAMRRGGVIPHIEAVAEPGNEPVEIPTDCPSCGSPTRVEGDFLYCSQPSQCSAAQFGTLMHFTRALEIDGFGPKIVEQLFDRDLVKHPADLFALEVQDLLPLERMGTKLATKLVDNVQSKRNLPLSTFLVSLGIQDLGKTISRTVAAHYTSLDALLAASEEDIAHIHGVGEVMARHIKAGLEDNAELIEALRAYVTVEDHVTEAPVEPSDRDHALLGRSVVFTGKMVKMGRKEAQEIVTQHGGATPSGVSASLDYLVVGDEGSPLLGEGKLSSKHKKAEALQSKGSSVRIITEAAFFEMVESGKAPE